MATTFLSPVGNDANFTVSGVPATGYKLFTYLAGTTTKQTTYQDNAAATPNANPILLSSQGYPASGGNVVEIWLSQGVTYKFVLAPSTDTDPPTSPVWTRDNISGENDPTNITAANEWIQGTTPSFISTTSFSVAGDLRTIYQIGRRVKTTNSGGTIYSRITNSTFASSITTVTVVNDSGVLDSGLTAVSYGILSETNPSIPLINNIPIGSVTPSTGAFTSLTATIFITYPPVCNGRLTLTTATPITISDVTAATSILFTPYAGNVIGLYDGSANWNAFTFAELSIAVPATTSQMYDVFAFNNSGVVALELLAWTNDTTRATALVLQNGVLVKTGATTRRYLGSFRTTTVSGQTEDSVAKRYVWNYYNRVLRQLKVVEATSSWTQSGGAVYRQANSSAANQVDIVIGYQEVVVEATVFASGLNSGSFASGIGIGVDSSTVNSALISSFFFTTPTQATGISARYLAYTAIGKHTLIWQEISGGNTTTWYGTNSGGQGMVQSGLTANLMG